MFGNVPQLRIDNDHFVQFAKVVDAALTEVGAASAATAEERAAAKAKVTEGLMDFLAHIGWGIPKNQEKKLSNHLNAKADASQTELI